MHYALKYQQTRTVFITCFITPIDKLSYQIWQKIVNKLKSEICNVQLLWFIFHLHSVSVTNWSCLKYVCDIYFHQGEIGTQKFSVFLASPGRLVDHLENTKGFNLRTLKYLVGEYCCNCSCYFWDKFIPTYTPVQCFPNLVTLSLGLQMIRIQI